MRIAWLGPLANDGGVPAMGRLLMLGLLNQGVEIDYFSDKPDDKVIGFLGDHPLLTTKQIPSWWQWGQWYSRHPFLAFISSTIARTQTHRETCNMIVKRNSDRHYDCIFQFSQFELFGLSKHFAELPPVIVYPCVHTAGELKWHRKESAYALRSESKLTHYITRFILKYRTRIQRREAHKPALIVGMSKRFNELITKDYNLRSKKMSVLYHPIDIQPLAPIAPIEGRKVKLIFAGRISVRKGIEMLVELSKRLDDLKDEIEIEVIGGYTQWSDYRKNLDDLNPATAKYVGEMSNAQLMEAFSQADLLIVPSHYEPGGIVVGEATGRGMCVVATDEVGSAEPLEGPFIRKFKAGSMNEFEKYTREMIEQLKTNQDSLREAARAAAETQFQPDKIAGDLHKILKEVCGS
jgi:glycosyltransferase involved in cell wall biosynthesis